MLHEKSFSSMNRIISLCYMCIHSGKSMASLMAGASDISFILKRYVEQRKFVTSSKTS